MKKFIIDTSGKTTGIGFFDGKENIYENYFKTDRNYNSILITVIEEALKKSNMQMKDFDVFATTLGPGSFTGIRVGISFIKAFASIFEKKVFGMSTLDIMKASIDTDERIYPALDAKRSEVYTLEYKKNEIFYRIISLEKYMEIIKKERAVALLLKDDYNLVETLRGNSKIKLQLLEKIDLNVMNIKIEENKDKLLNPYNLMPVYIRESDAETNLKRKK